MTELETNGDDIQGFALLDRGGRGHARLFSVTTMGDDIQGIALLDRGGLGHGGLFSVTVIIGVRVIGEVCVRSGLSSALFFDSCSCFVPFLLVEPPR